MHARRIAAATAATLLAVLGTAAFAATRGDATPATTARPAAAKATAPARCTTPAPTTAKGYAAMFAKVDTRQWGAADVGISVPLADGRAVWLWGDTFSQGRFVHSTAITQDRGCLHVSHAGAQLLPDQRTVPVAKRTKANPGIVYWIEAAHANTDGTLTIAAEEQALFGPGVWDFKYTGYTRTALAKVDAKGDVTFVRWTARKAQPAADAGTLTAIGPHHFTYSHRAHPEARLASGKTLWSSAQNWDDGILHPFSAYRPIFTER